MRKSFAFKTLKFCGFNFSEKEYGEVSFYSIFVKGLKKLRNAFLISYCTDSVLLSSFNARSIRPKVWRKIGVKIGKGVFIGKDVMPDLSNTHLIEIEDNVHIAARSIILCHQRDMHQYYKGDDYSKLPYIRKKVILKKGCLIGTQCIVMPGVTIGEGAVVGAFSLVTKDIPPWSVAHGIPAKVIKNIPQKV